MKKSMKNTFYAYAWLALLWLNSVNAEIDFKSYNRMKLYLIDSNLRSKLEKLFFHLREINSIYIDYENKEEFHFKILEYLEK